MTADGWMLGAVLVMFNGPVLAVLACLPFIRQLGGALREKSRGPDSSGMTSYSRITGLFGAVVVAAFFWALGNLILYMEFSRPADVARLVDDVWKFFLAGAALFLPYAFNQLGGVLSPTAMTGASSAGGAGAQAVGVDGRPLNPGVIVPAARRTAVG